MSESLFGQKISDTYHKLLQITSGGTVVDGDGNLSIFSYGTYTPTLYNIKNVSGNTASLCQYMKVGNVVTVSGKVNFTPIDIASITILDISLPIASNFDVINNCAGSAACDCSTAPGAGASISTDSGHTKAEMTFLPNNTEEQSMFFNFTYQIL